MITSTSNEKVKHVTELVKNARARRKEGLFVVEGVRIAGEIPQELCRNVLFRKIFVRRAGSMRYFRMMCP